MPACAALDSWDGYTAAGSSVDAGPNHDAAKLPSDAGAGPTEAGSDTITVIEIANISIDGKQTAVDVPFQSPPTPGSVLIAAIGWYDAQSTITLVTDTQGNTYNTAVGPTARPGMDEDLTQQVFYTRALGADAGGPSTLHITFGGRADSPDIRAIAVNGLTAADPFVAKIDASGRGLTATATIPATPQRGILFAAEMTSDDLSKACDPAAFQLCIPSMDDNLAEARVLDRDGGPPVTVTTTDSESKTADWVLQLATFQ